MTLPAGGTLLVRVAIIRDASFEGTETFKLTATNMGGTGYDGTGTIKDDGTGDLFMPDNNTPTPNSFADPAACCWTIDDDRNPLVAPKMIGQSGAAGTTETAGTVKSRGEDGTTYIGNWESIRSGAVISRNGNIAFRGHMEVGTGSVPVSVGDFQGIWVSDGTTTTLKARSGSVAPETGGALFDMLPLNPTINNQDFITFHGSLRLGTGSPVVTSANNQGLWTELGGGVPRLLVRKGDTIIGSKTYSSASNVAVSSVNTVALNSRLSSNSAVLHVDVNTPVALVTVLAETGQAAPGGGVWWQLEGNSSELRMSPNGNLSFIGWELDAGSALQGIYSRLATVPVGTSGLTVEARVGNIAPGTSGATFSALDRPTAYDAGMAFRGFLNNDGDNALGNKSQGVWAGPVGSLLPLVRTGDTTTQIPSIPAGASVVSVWSPFSNERGSVTMRVSLFNGVSETRAIMGNTGGTLRVIAKAGDAATGLTGETFTNFDHPVIGGCDQVAFTASTNTGKYGIWKESPRGGPLELVMLVGDTVTTSEGPKVISNVSLPGGTSEDRKFESPCMDIRGRVIVHVTFSDNSTSVLLSR